MSLPAEFLQLGYPVPQADDFDDFPGLLEACENANRQGLEEWWTGDVHWSRFRGPSDPGLLT
ncbi:MAG: hypothetical protein QM775_00450 [Pirellulales bacterium]